MLGVTAMTRCTCARRYNELFSACARRCSELFSASRNCRNENPRVNPIGSTTFGRVGTDDGSRRSTLSRTRSQASPQPKPSDQPMKSNEQKFDELRDMFPEIMQDANLATNEVILSSLRRAGPILRSSQKSDYWTSEEGQATMLRKIKSRECPPAADVNVFDYTEESKALLYSAGSAGQEEWIEVELCADTGACATVMQASCARGFPYSRRSSR